ncbi:MAG: hypothetical protein K6T91_09380 [Firmicutes bacterium]|nr:hypothetical protein [Bacillota bacterium]
MSSLISIIERDLTETKEELLKNAFSGHVLLENQFCDADNLPLATLLFATASCGSYRSEELKPVAVGLELLRLAVEKHYHESPRNSTERNIFLITADYYYAKAIRIAAELKKSYVVKIMVRAIADIARLEACGPQKGLAASENKKYASLFDAAVTIGARLGNCSADMEAVKEHAALILKELSQPLQNHLQ